MQWFVKAMKNYVGFSGRSRRTEYWMFTLFVFIIGIAVSAVQQILLNPAQPGQGTLTWLWNLAVLLPSLAVGVRRLHDTNRSGWWLLIGLIPLVGAIVLIVFFVTEGNRGQNQYGPDPKGDQMIEVDRPNPGYAGA